MSRHRNVRSMRYSDEYDGYDDVYGHSVEEDYPMSPSDAAFFYDRNNRQPQLSSFLKSDDIQEEDDSEESGAEKAENKSDVEKILKDCLRQIKEIAGTQTPDDELVSLIVKSRYDVDAALNLLYSKGEGGKEQAAPKPQRKTTDRKGDRPGAKKGRKTSPSTVFSATKFFSSKNNRNNDPLSGNYSRSHRRLLKATNPLLNSKLSTLGYYLCRKTAEKQTALPMKLISTPIPDDIVPFKFDILAPDDVTIVRKY